MKKIKNKEKREIGALTRLNATLFGFCQVCLIKESTAIASCRRNRSRLIQVCDDCSADFPDAVRKDVLSMYNGSVVGMC
jgi:hypothetical protein